MRILVTGAAGFIGSHLTERLARQGHEVVGVDCFTDYYSRDLKERNADNVRAAGADFLECDLASDSLEAALAGSEYLEATAKILHRHNGLWFNDESFVVSRKPD